MAQVSKACSAEHRKAPTLTAREIGSNKNNNKNLLSVNGDFLSFVFIQFTRHNTPLGHPSLLPPKLLNFPDLIYEFRRFLVSLHHTKQKQEIPDDVCSFI